MCPFDSCCGTILTRKIIRELVKQGSKRAIAVCRKSSAELDTEAAKHPDVIQVIVGIDVTKEHTMSKMCAALGGDPLDMVINNAGYFCEFACLNSSGSRPNSFLSPSRHRPCP